MAEADHLSASALSAALLLVATSSAEWWCMLRAVCTRKGLQAYTAVECVNKRKPAKQHALSLCGSGALHVVGW